MQAKHKFASFENENSLLYDDKVDSLKIRKRA
jgi:hypothetical protein